jgi:hypothetical protein
MQRLFGILPELICYRHEHPPCSDIPNARLQRLRCSLVKNARPDRPIQINPPQTQVGSTLPTAYRALAREQ